MKRNDSNEVAGVYGVATEGKLTIAVLVGGSPSIMAGGVRWTFHSCLPLRLRKWLCLRLLQ
jgi:hypothetical protein